MCVVSMVYDHYNPIIPDRLTPLTPPGPIVTPPYPTPEQIRRTQEIIDAFKTARDAAKIVDELTKQPDCEDPEKKKLEERVAKLEKQISEILAATTLEPKQAKAKIVSKAGVKYKTSKGQKKKLTKEKKR